MAGRRFAVLLSMTLMGCGGIAVIDGDPLVDDALGQVCGGATAASCGPNTYCARAPSVGCDGEGVCTARPSSCGDDAPGACACDGFVYPNPCVARAIGVEVEEDAWCPLQANAQASLAADRLTFMYQDATVGACVRLVAMQGVTSAYAVSLPEPWQAVSIAVYQTTDSCLKASVTPPAPPIEAEAVTGEVALESYGVPGLSKQYCRLPTNLEVSAPSAPWLPAPFSIASPGTPVDGECP